VVGTGSVPPAVRGNALGSEVPGGTAATNSTKSIPVVTGTMFIARMLTLGQPARSDRNKVLN